MSNFPDNPQYSDFVTLIKQKIKHAKNKVIVSVNRELIELYFEIGKSIIEKQETLGWGRSVVEQMAKDLQAEFGKRSGFSSQNLWYMRQFYDTYKSNANLQQLVGEIPWGHNILIFSKCKNEKEREYYVENTIAFGWSRNVLTHHIKTDLYKRDKKQLKQNNFKETLPATVSDVADDMMKSEYNLEFLGISKEAKERELESSIIENIKRFLLELGYGFSFVGNQYKLALNENEYFIDLLFFHRKLNALVAIELKIGKFRPEYAGKMNFYLNLLNDTVKMPHENPAIGIILCSDKDSLEVEYAIQNTNQPLGVATYTIETSLPSELEELLPTSDEIKKVLNEK
jgi:predicted nuclease of restriction endonuclease-like (RecB) superfamily